MTKTTIENKYCSECEHLARFEEVRLIEKVKVKNSMIENEHIYYQCNQCKELFEPFDDPDYNAKLDFEKYKKLNGLLSSKEIKKIRLFYSLSLRQMADLIGISYSTLSEIENGSIQSKLLNNVFLSFKDPFAARNVFKERAAFLSENFDGFLKQIDILCVREEESLSELREEIRNELSELRDQTNDMLARVNLLEYDVSHFSEEMNSDTRNGEIKWKVPITRIMAQL